MRFNFHVAMATGTIKTEMLNHIYTTQWLIANKKMLIQACKLYAPQTKYVIFVNIEPGHAEKQKRAKYKK